jgi:hypothetical protein
MLTKQTQHLNFQSTKRFMDIQQLKEQQINVQYNMYLLKKISSYVQYKFTAVILDIFLQTSTLFVSERPFHCLCPFIQTHLFLSPWNRSSMFGIATKLSSFILFPEMLSLIHQRKGDGRVNLHNLAQLQIGAVW